VCLCLWLLSHEVSKRARQPWAGRGPVDEVVQERREGLDRGPVDEELSGVLTQRLDFRTVDRLGSSSRVGKWRYNVPVPTPARDAKSSNRRSSSPRSKATRAAATIASRFRAASARIGRGVDMSSRSFDEWRPSP